MKNLLVLAPHTDDESVGCGASLGKLAQSRKWFTKVIGYSTAGQPGIEDEFYKACEYLGVNDYEIFEHEEMIGLPRRRFPKFRQMVLDSMIDEARSREWDMVWVPSSSDVHQDHAVVSEEAKRAFKGTTVWGYEMPWNCYGFSPDQFVVLEWEDIANKIQAIRCYNSQKERNYVGSGLFGSMAMMRGKQCEREYAESFEIIRQIW